MCQAIPARVVRIDGDRAWVEDSNASISLLGVEGVAVGDYILRHAGFALARVEPEEAAALADALDQLERLYASE